MFASFIFMEIRRRNGGYNTSFTCMQQNLIFFSEVGQILLGNRELRKNDNSNWVGSILSSKGKARYKTEFLNQWWSMHLKLRTTAINNSSLEVLQLAFTTYVGYTRKQGKLN